MLKYEKLDWCWYPMVTLLLYLPMFYFIKIFYTITWLIVKIMDFSFNTIMLKVIYHQTLVLHGGILM